MRCSLNDNLTNYWKTIYPVGSIYISTSSTNPGTLFGGTWSAFGAGRVLIGVGTGKDSNNVSKTFAVNNTGGEYNHTLSGTEMPAHMHKLCVDGNSGYPIAMSGWQTANPTLGNYRINVESTAATNGFWLNTSTDGGGGAHNNIQPYIAVYMWKRTA